MILFPSSLYLHSCLSPLFRYLLLTVIIVVIVSARASTSTSTTWRLTSIGRTIHVFNASLVAPDLLVLTSLSALARLDAQTSRPRWRLPPPLSTTAPVPSIRRSSSISEYTHLPLHPRFAAAVTPASPHPTIILILLSDNTLRAVHSTSSATLWHAPACRLGTPRPSAVPVTTCDGTNRWLHPLTGARLEPPPDSTASPVEHDHNTLRALPSENAPTLHWHAPNGAALTSEPDGTLRLVGADGLERWRRHDGIAHVVDGAIFAPPARPPAVVLLSRLGALYAVERPGVVRWKLPLSLRRRCSLLHAIAHTAVVVCTAVSTTNDAQSNSGEVDDSDTNDDAGDVDAQPDERVAADGVATFVTAVRVADGVVVFEDSLRGFRAERAALDDCCGRHAICVAVVDGNGQEARIAQCTVSHTNSISSSSDVLTASISSKSSESPASRTVSASTPSAANDTIATEAARDIIASSQTLSPDASGRGWLLYMRGGGEVRGVRGGATVWRLPMPAGAVVSAVVTLRPPHPVASRLRPPAVRVTGFRTLLRKFVDENVALVLAEDASAGEVHALVVDARSGALYNAVTHPNAHAPVAGVRGDNWFVYTFWSESMLQQEVHIIDMYHRARNTSWVGETLRMAVRALLGDEIMAAFGIPDPDRVPPCQPPNTTLLDDQQCVSGRLSYEAKVAERSLPLLKRSSSIMTQRVVALDVTETLLGITESSIIMTLESGQVSLVSKMLLDARRPKVSSPQHMAEMLMPYKPVLSLESSARQSMYVADGLHTPAVRKVAVAPCRERESTTQVAVLGMDLIYSLMQPAGSFDELPDDFVYSAGVAMVVFLAGGVFYSHKLKMRSSLSRSW